MPQINPTNVCEFETKGDNEKDGRITSKMLVK